MPLYLCSNLLFFTGVYAWLAIKKIKIKFYPVYPCKINIIHRYVIVIGITDRARGIQVGRIVRKMTGESYDLYFPVSY